MCVQLDNLFTCGHRSFKRFDNCARFGISCLGAGPNHVMVTVARVCHDCKVRLHDQTQTSAGGSPDSGESSGGSGGSGGAEKDPWAEGDPWKKKRKR